MPQELAELGSALQTAQELMERPPQVRWTRCPAKNS